MEIKALNIRQNSFTDNTLTKMHIQFEALLGELRKHALPENILRSVNLSVDKLNASTLSEKALKKFIKQ